MFRFLIAVVLALSVGMESVPCVVPEETVLLPVVMYHHISENRDLLGKYVIHPEELEKDLRWLRENGYESVSVPELIAWEKGQGTLPEKPVMITFDDGFESVGVYAEPLLRQYGYKAEVAVIGSVAQQFSDQEDHHLSYSHLSWEAAGELDEREVLRVQCHTWNMHQLKPRKGCAAMAGESEECYRKNLEADIRQFQLVMEEKTGRKAETLMLPYGSISPTTCSHAETLGFQAVFTCTEQVNRLRRAEKELFSLGRFNRPSGISSETFFAQWQSGREKPDL